MAGYNLCDPKCTCLGRLRCDLSFNFIDHSVQDIGNTVCINPGRMAKGQVGGTFTRLTVDYKPSQSSDMTVFTQCVKAEIVRI